MGNGPKSDEDQKGVEPALVEKPPGDGVPTGEPAGPYCQEFSLESPTASAAQQSPNVATRGQADPGRYRVFAGETLLGYAPLAVSRNFDSRGGSEGVLSGVVISASEKAVVVRLCLEG